MSAENAYSGRKILVVEDSRTQAEYLLHILEREGYQAVHAINGHEALELINTEKPALVLTDIIMPAMDGYALCSAIKTNELTADIPVILVTQLFDPPDLIKGLEAGADDIIIKPFKPEHVISRITGTLRSRAQPDSDTPSRALEVSFEGETHLIPEDPLRTPAIILSSYTAAMRKNAELHEANEQLTAVNDDLRKEAERLQLENERLLSAGTREPPGSIEKEPVVPGRDRENERRFRMITELSPFPISIVDRSGTYRYVNRQFLHLFGYAIPEIPPDWPVPASPGCPGHADEGAENSPERMKGGGTIPPRIIPLTAKDGTTRQIRFWPLILETGERVAVYEELSYKTESDRLRSVLASIVNSSNDAIIGKALDGTILSWNRAAERYYGYLAEEVIGKSIEIIMPPETRVHLPLFLQRVASGETIDRFDTIRMRKDGTRISVRVTLSPIKDDEGRIFGISTIAQNISGREKSEADRPVGRQDLRTGE